MFLLAILCETLEPQTIISVEQAARLVVPQTRGELQCQVIPLRPVLDFSFRFQAGYMAQVPLRQYRGPGHKWVLITRIEPELTRQPVYLLDRLNLPDVPDENADGEAGGGYVLGEGRYLASFALMDDEGRVCRAGWTIEARLGAAAHTVKMASGPGTVREISLRYGRAPVSAPIRRMTVLLHAAPVSPRMSKVQANDAMILLESLSSLLDLVPARSVRLVVFSLDRQKEIYRDENFTLDQLEAVRQAIFDLQLSTVDYRQLQNPAGPANFLSRLVTDELRAETRSDAVVFLGPYARSAAKPVFHVEAERNAKPVFFYVEYRSQRPPSSAPGAARDEFAGVGTFIASQARTSQTGNDLSGNGTWVIPDPAQVDMIDGRANFASARDAIDYLVSQLKGRTLPVTTPQDFSKAIQRIAAH
jgi:hypothetical protein